MTERAAVYARISEDPREIGAGVERQLEDGKALVGTRGWTLAGTFADNNVAVLRAGADRPGYAALMAAVERGEVTRVVAYGLSRLVRNRRERAEMIEFLGQRRVSVALVKGSDLDLSSAAGRAVTGLLGEMDTMESEIKSERVARAALQRAEQGKASGHVSYGWRRERVCNPAGEVIDWRDDVDPDEAKIVNEIVDRLLGGTPINAITADLNAREVPSPRGGPWGRSSVRKIALRASNVGDRVHHGKVLGAAAWPALVDRDRHDRVVALLNGPGRATSRSGARRHLLSYGIGECGKCGHELRVATRGGHAMYVCDSAAGCVGRRQAWVDKWVGMVLIKWLSKPGARDLFTRDDPEAAEAAEAAEGLRAKLLTVQDDYDDGVITREMYLRSVAKHRAALDEAEVIAMRQVQGVSPAVVDKLTGAGAAEHWEGLTVPEQRAFLEGAGVRVVIDPARGGPGFKPESVRVIVRFEDIGHESVQVLIEAIERFIDGWPKDAVAIIAKAPKP